MTTTIKLAATDLIPALRNVALFATADDTLPALTGVLLDYGTETGVALAATDRYMLARQDVPAEVTADAPGVILLSKETVKQLLGIKPSGYDAPTVITVDGDSYTIALPGGMTFTHQTDAGFQPFAWRMMWDRFMKDLDGQTASDATAPANVMWNARYLARFAKVRGGDRGEVYIKITQHASETQAMITCGPVSVVAMTVRIAS